MKISYSWIREFVDLDVDAYTAAKALTMSGTEVEDITAQSIPKEVICARVLTADKHPNADKLFVCIVDTGTEKLQVICGAPNTKAGMLSAFAPVGCDLGPGMLVKKAKIRGVESFGVLLSEKELGLTDDHTGIIELDENLKPGDVLLDVLKLEDWVLEVNVTPNRGDCLSVMGIARELAALFGKNLKKPEFTIKEEGTPVESLLSVEIISPEGCPRYTGRYMDGVVIKKSPFFMRRRLFQSGVRAISNVVDITNYVMLEYGQPLHAFDSTLVAGSGIVVRYAGQGEKFVTLDSVERTLRSTDLLICDREKPVALAGVMGGENSEVLDSTASVVLESAYFSPAGIQRTSKGLGLSTEASYRFERGIDPSIQVEAANRATWFMQLHANAKVARGVIDVNFFSYEKREVKLRKSYLEKVLGISDMTSSDVERIFTGLGCDVREGSGEWDISVPVFRHDLLREIDLVEEFIRIYGMDKVPPELPSFRPDRVDALESGIQAIRLRLAAMGLTEVITYSFIAPKWKEIFKGDTLDLLNPISDEMKVMRMSLIPGLAGAIERNRKLAVRDMAIFEIGRCFCPVASDSLPSEFNRLGIALTGQRFDAHWSEKGRQVDFYDIKGAAENLLGKIELRPSTHPFYKEGCQADVFKNGITIGTMGCLHDNVNAMLDIDGDIFALEITLESMLDRKWHGLREIPKFPSTWRDLSLVVDSRVTYQDIIRAIESKGIDEIRQISAVDLYTGEKLPSGKKGLTIRITYQSDTRTLEDSMINKWQEKIMKSLQEDLGITLRQ